MRKETNKFKSSFAGLVRGLYMASALILSLLWAGPTWAHTHGVVTAVELPQAPVLDGKADGWTAPFVHVSTEPPAWYLGKSRFYGKAPKSNKDIEAWYSVAWKGDRLFLTAVVLDDNIIKNHDPNLGGAWNADSVEVYFSFNHDAGFYSEGRTVPYRADDYQMRFIPFAGEKGVYGGDFLGSHASEITDAQFHKAVKSVSRAYSFGDRKGYLIQSSIDVAGLGYPNLLKPGKVIGFEFVVNDADSDKGRDRMLPWSSVGNRAYNDSSCFGDMVIAGPSGTFVPPAESISTDKEGYFLLPGKPEFQTAGQALENLLPDDSAGRVVYTAAPPADAKNISGMFDPNPYRPISGPQIRYCQVGYLPNGKKTAYLEMPAGDKPPADVFSIIQFGKEAFSAPIKKWGTLWLRDYYLLDFNKFDGTGEGFTLSVGETKSAAFPIAPGVYDATVSMALHGVLVAEKCGVDAGDFHPLCHTDDAVQAGPDDVRSGQKILQFPPVFKPGTRIDESGGWHDAGDFGKYMGNVPHTMEGFLLVEREFHPKLELDNQGRDAMVQEAEYTADWCLKMQDKDGGVFERVWNGFDYKGTIESEKNRLLDSDKWSNVTARWVAAAAFGAQAIGRADPAYAEKLRKSAEKGLEYVENCPTQPDQPWAFGVYPGNNSCFFWAAVELYRLTKDDKYLQSALGRLPEMLLMKPTFLGWDGNNTIALIRFFPVMPNGPDKDKVRAWLLKRIKDIEKGEAKTPFGVDYSAQAGWGNNGIIVSRALEHYLIREILPDSGDLDPVESYRQWIYGANPAGYCFIVGRGSRQVLHQCTGIKKNMPGALVPGVIDDGSGLPFYIDSDASYITNEAGPDASVIFLSYMEAPWTKTLALQDPAVAQKEFNRATVKPARPDSSLVVDLNNLSVDAIWSGGDKGGSIDKSIVETAPGGGIAFRGDFKVGEWCTSVIPAGGNLSNSTALAFHIRGNGCKLRVAIDDANAEDWGEEMTVSPDWKAVTYYFSDLVQPSWTVEKDKLALDLSNIQKFKIQPLDPSEGWFEVSNVRKVAAPVKALKAGGLLKLEEGDSLWATGDGGFNLDKSIEAGPLLHVKYKLGQWCATGVLGNFAAGHYKGFKFKAKGEGVGLRVAVEDSKNHDFGQTLSLTGDLAEYTVLFSGMRRAPWENKDKDAPLDPSVLSQIKLQPMSPATGEFWISDIQWVK